MLPTTLRIIKSALEGDPSLAAPERGRVLALVRNGLTPTKADETQGERVARIVRRKEVARMLGCSLTVVDGLAKDGTLPRVKLPGRTRGAGFREADVLVLIGAKATAA